MKFMKCLKTVSSFLLAIVAVSMGASAVSADGMIIPFELDLGYIQVEFHHVEVTIGGPIARTRVHQRFYNPYNQTITGRYIFPLPPDVSITNFNIKLDGEPQSLHRALVAESEEYLKEAITNHKDPSLLQYLGWETYAVDLFLPAQGSLEMMLDYEEIIQPQGNLLRYFYTLGTERYSAWPLQEVSVRVDLKSEQGIANVYSPGHPLSVQRLNPDHVRATYLARDVLPTEHFELYYNLTEETFGAAMLTSPDPERSDEGHFMFLFSPSSTLSSTDSAPKDIVFVMDRSGSMAGEKIMQAKEAMDFILGQLNERDRFAVIAFDDLIESSSEGLQGVSSRSVQSAQAYVERLFDRGDTDIEAALRRALKLLEDPRPEAVPTVIFLTDGIATAGITDDRSILDYVRTWNWNIEASIHVFGVGYDVNTHLLDQIAAQNHGDVTYVLPNESLEVALTSFYNKIAYPVLTDVSIAFNGMNVVDIHPKALSDLFLGSNMAIAGRYTSIQSDMVSVTISGLLAGETWLHTYSFDHSDAESKPFVARVWATRQIGELLDLVRLEGESDKLVAEIRRLGLRFGVVTPYTTELIWGQEHGAASITNMQLYYQDNDGDGVPDVRKGIGEATVGARAQNLAYQQTQQANLALGANVVSIGDKNVAQMGLYGIDLNLITNIGSEFNNAVDDSWVQKHADRIIIFASDEYFKLAEDKVANQLMQAGPNVVFEHHGEVIAVQASSTLSQLNSPESKPEMSIIDWLRILLEPLFNTIQ
ncbi:MAG: VWA domain-containing protein [Anaerolineales bacterium]|nr:VWA domain-containing protein [Anaerolineales bacterium]